jgi:hypothetical protein
MSDCKNTTKAGPSSGFDFGAISNILSIITSVFGLVQKPVTSIPPPLLLIGAKLRPGLSARNIASRIISRQSEAGAPTGDIFSEDNNISESMETIRVQEIINAVQTEAKVEITIPPGVQISAVGAGNFGFPVVVQGATTNIATGEGIIR